MLLGACHLPLEGSPCCSCLQVAPQSAHPLKAKHERLGAKGSFSGLLGLVEAPVTGTHLSIFLLPSAFPAGAPHALAHPHSCPHREVSTSCHPRSTGLQDLKSTRCFSKADTHGDSMAGLVSRTPRTLPNPFPQRQAL